MNVNECWIYMNGFCQRICLSSSHSSKTFRICVVSVQRRIVRVWKTHFARFCLLCTSSYITTRISGSELGPRCSGWSLLLRFVRHPRRKCTKTDVDNIRIWMWIISACSFSISTHADTRCGYINRLRPLMTYFISRVRVSENRMKPG